MRKSVATWLVVVALVAASTSSAWAHNLTVKTPHGNVKTGWVGGPALPGQGKGLIPGGPTGQWLISPAHAKGLNTACEALRANGNGVVDISGPGPSCPHGM